MVLVRDESAKGPNDRSVPGGAAIKPPAQARSRRTLERILAATRHLLERKTFDALSVAEIVRRAGSSVGSFYARFADKDALLDHLDERYAQEMVGFQEAFVAGARRQPRSLDREVTELVSWLVRYHRRRRGLLRALVLRARSRREPRFSERTTRMNQRLPGLIAVLLRHRREIRHPRPKQAVCLGFLFAFSALRERILFPESILTPEPRSDSILVRELAMAWLAYLGCGGGMPRRRKAAAGPLSQGGVA